MKNFFSYLIDVDHHKKIEPILDYVDKIEQGHALLNEAARSTIELAKDVSETLRDKIDDCLIHIDTTNNILQDALIVTDASGIIQTINRAAEKIFGYSDASISGNHITVLLSLESNVKLNLNFNMELFSEEVNIPSNYLENFMGKRKTGELFYINASSSKVTKRNKVTYYIIVIRDETKRVESEQYFKAFSDASCEAMMIHDGKQIINFNNKLIELSEFSTEELSTFKPVYLFIFENYEDMMTRYNAEVTASYESILRSKSGKLIAIAVTSKPVIWEGGKARIRVFHDISSYKERIKYLEQVKLNHNIVISGITDLICCFDKSFNITFSNQIFCDYFNLDISKVVGTSILTFISEEDKQELTKNILNLDKENTIVTSVHKLQSYNENDYHESVNRCIFDDDGQFIEYQIVIKPDSLNKT